MNGVLIDENLPAGLVGILGVAGVHATSLGAQPTDEALWLHARQENLVVFTRDADFFNKLVIHGPPPKVVWLRTGTRAGFATETQSSQSPSLVGFSLVRNPWIPTSVPPWQKTVWDRT